MKTQAISYQTAIKESFSSKRTSKPKASTENKNFGRLIFICLIVNILATMYLVGQMIELF